MSYQLELPIGALTLAPDFAAVSSAALRSGAVVPTSGTRFLRSRDSGCLGLRRHPGCGLPVDSVSCRPLADSGFPLKRCRWPRAVQSSRTWHPCRASGVRRVSCLWDLPSLAVRLRLPRTLQLCRARGILTRRGVVDCLLGSASPRSLASGSAVIPGAACRSGAVSYRLFVEFDVPRWCVSACRTLQPSRMRHPGPGVASYRHTIGSMRT